MVDEVDVPAHVISNSQVVKRSPGPREDTDARVRTLVGNDHDGCRRRDGTFHWL